MRSGAVESATTCPVGEQANDRTAADVTANGGLTFARRRDVSCEPVLEPHEVVFEPREARRQRRHEYRVVGGAEQPEDGDEVHVTVRVHRTQLRNEQIFKSLVRIDVVLDPVGGELSEPALRALSFTTLK